eukprot:83259-Chlamydomonas_euryale.AAC.9
MHAGAERETAEIGSARGRCMDAEWMTAGNRDGRPVDLWVGRPVDPWSSRRNGVDNARVGGEGLRGRR